MPRITLQTRYEDGNVAHEHVSNCDDLNTVLTWAATNWHPAQGGRIIGTSRFYLNDRLLVSTDGGEFVPVITAMQRANTPVGLAA